jgi:hypothetical protein
MVSEVLADAPNVVAEFTTMATDWVAEVTTGGDNAVTALATGIADMAAKVLETASTVVAEFTTMATNFVAAIQSGIDGVVALFATLKDITIKWPEIPNPFASVAGWAANAVATAQAAWAAIAGGGGSAGGGTRDQMWNSSFYAGDVVTIRGRADRGEWTIVSEGTKKGRVRIKKGNERIAEYTKDLILVPQLATGGYIGRDMLANLHEGEYVVPAADVKAAGGIGGGMSIVNHYSFGNVYGVDELQKLLDRRDRELVRKLGALIT